MPGPDSKPKGAPRRKVRPQRMGPHALTGSREAKRIAAVVLEVLSGLRDSRGGSEALSITPSRYYLLETRALQGLITALEPRARGRQLTPEGRLARLEQENQRLERELSRSQALLRAAQRSLGLPRARKPDTLRRKGTAPTKTGKRRKRAPVRAKRMVSVLRSPEPEPVSSSPKVS